MDAARAPIGPLPSTRPNCLLNQLRMPLGTTDGHDFTFISDVYWTDSYVGITKFNHKLQQLTSGGTGNTIWLESDVTYAPHTAAGWKPSDTPGFDPQKHVGAFHMRSMQETVGPADWTQSDGNSRGPTSTDFNPLAPCAPFNIARQTWTRFFVRVDQRVNDYDYIDTWIADEMRDPVQVVFNVPVSVRLTNGVRSMDRWWGAELNTSTSTNVRPDGRDLVSYMRNFLVMRDVADMRDVLIRPGASAPPQRVLRAPYDVNVA